jgi:hypothetical protein
VAGLSAGQWNSKPEVDFAYRKTEQDTAAVPSRRGANIRGAFPAEDQIHVAMCPGAWVACGCLAANGVLRKRLPANHQLVLSLLPDGHAGCREHHANTRSAGLSLLPDLPWELISIQPRGEGRLTGEMPPGRSWSSRDDTEAIRFPFTTMGGPSAILTPALESFSSPFPLFSFDRQSTRRLPLTNSFARHCCDCDAEQPCYAVPWPTEN